MQININKQPNIFKHTLFFAILLPVIQGTQLYFLFDILNPILLIMPIVMGSITGYLVGYYKYHVYLQIKELEDVKNGLEEQVQEQTKELHELLLLDPLTGLGNRLKLKEVLSHEVERIGKEYENISFLMIDIDYFKKYNDFYGHLLGDDVLKHLGNFFKTKMLKTQNSVIRFGGEEFIVILPDSDVENSLKVAEYLVRGVRELNIEHEKSDIDKKITISVGIHTTSNITLVENSEYIKQADKALYLAKEQGRNIFIHSLLQ